MKADLEDHVCRKHLEVATHSSCPSCQGKFPKEIAKMHVENCSLPEDKTLNLNCRKVVGCTEDTHGFHLTCEKHRGSHLYFRTVVDTITSLLLYLYLTNLYCSRARKTGTHSSADSVLEIVARRLLPKEQKSATLM